MEHEHTSSILIVDDNPTALQHAETVLRQLDQKLVLARSGKEALRHLLDQDFAAIVMDVRMPEMDGFETAELIRQRSQSRHTPLLFVTSSDDDADLLRGYALGAVDYLRKPFLPEALLAKIAVFVELSQRTDEIRRLAEENELRQRGFLSAIDRVLRGTLNTSTDDEVAQVCVSAAAELTGSRFSFLGEITAGGRFAITAMSDSTRKACRIPDAALTLDDFVIRGTWGRILQEDRAVIVDDPASDSLRLGLPPGHVPLTSFLGVPLHHANQVLGVIGVANNPAGYNDAQQHDLEAFSLVLVEMLLRRRSEIAVQRKTEELNRFFDISPDLLGIAENGGAFRRVNPAFERALGYTSEQLTSRPSLEFVHPDDVAATRGAEATLAAQRPLDNFVNRYRCRDGSYRWIEWRSAPAGDLIYSAARDVTARKQAEDEVRKAKSMLANIIDSMPAILAGIDPSGNVIQWNAEAQRATGICADAAMGRPIGSILPDFASSIESLQADIRQGRPAKIERLSVEQSGEQRYFDLMFYPLVSNGIRGAVLRIDDVTRQARWQAMMIQTEKMSSLGGLAAGMAHEINNPLGIISQAAENIQRRLSPDLSANQAAARELGISIDCLQAYHKKRQITEFLRHIREAAERAARIVGNMLQFSRGSDVSSPEPAVLCDLMDKAVELAANDYDLTRKYDFRNIEIERDYAADLPPVMVLPMEIEQVLLNLLKNAAQALAATATGRKPRIALRARRDGDWAAMEVEDNGPGMSNEVRRRAFEPFFTTKAPGAGTGLGLYVSYMIVTVRHQGQIAVDSSPERGTRFTLRLPLTGRN